MRLFLTLIMTPLAAFALDLTDQQRADIESRIQPFSAVCIQGETCGGGDAVAESAGRSGEDVYNGACMACHSAGIAGAPATGDQIAWAGRISKGMDALYDSGINGVAGTGMIARGGCSDCSDDDIRAAVDFMVDSSR
ncbi:MAG: c-type cytochrome [Pseudomonadota bacterium]|nr:c-type cytochrome [Pseudomonadota bacterium]